MSDSVRPHTQQPTRLRRPWDSPGKNSGVGCHFLLQCMKVKSEGEVAQSGPILRDPMDCSLPGSSVHGIFQARVLEWVAIAFSKEYSNYHIIAFILHTSKVMFEILPAGLQQYVNYDILNVQAGFRKGRGTRDHIANIHWIKLPTFIGSSKKQEGSRKPSTSALLTMSKLLTVWITTNCGKILKRWKYQTTWPVSWEICMQVRKNNGLVPNRKRSMSRLYIVTLLI